MKKLLPLAVAIVLVTGCVENTKTTNAPVDPAAQRVLRRTAQAYASCKSYRDTGTVTNRFRSSGFGPFTSVIRFQTVFTRPDRFRFEYVSRDEDGSSERYVIWTTGKRVYAWWTVQPRIAAEQSLDMALAGATGVSSGSAHTAPRLLMPNEVTGWALTDLGQPRLIGTELVGGVRCFKIIGSDHLRNRHTFWVGCKDHLIRKIVEEMKSPSAVSTTVYHPELNPSIAASAFASGVEKPDRK